MNNNVHLSLFVMLICLLSIAARYLALDRAPGDTTILLQRKINETSMLNDSIKSEIGVGLCYHISNHALVSPHPHRRDCGHPRCIPSDAPV